MLRETARAMIQCLAAPTAVLVLALFGGCESSDGVDGQVFISGVKDAGGKTIGVSIDFVPATRDAILRKVELDIYARGASFDVDGASVSAACIPLPASGRATLHASSAELTADARVRVIARHAPSRASRGSSTAGAAGTSESQGCTGDPIDDAVWPNTGANVPPGVGGGGGSGGEGGAAGVSGAAGSAGVGGSEDAGGVGGTEQDAGPYADPSQEDSGADASG